MKQKSCPKSIDKPITVLGMEVEDVAVIMVILGVSQIIIGMVLALPLAIIAAFVVKQIKRGKPRGYLQHLLYHWGVNYPGTLPPPKKIKEYIPTKPIKKIKGIPDIFLETE